MLGCSVWCSPRTSTSLWGHISLNNAHRTTHNCKQEDFTNVHRTNQKDILPHVTARKGLLLNNWWFLSAASIASYKTSSWCHDGSLWSTCAWAGSGSSMRCYGDFVKLRGTKNPDLWNLILKIIRLIQLSTFKERGPVLFYPISRTKQSLCYLTILLLSLFLNMIVSPLALRSCCESSLHLPISTQSSSAWSTHHSITLIRSHVHEEDSSWERRPSITRLKTLSSHIIY